MAALVSKIQVHEGEFVRVHVPAYLARSLQLALGGVHAPFFTERDGPILMVVLRREEWERLASRFAAAEVAAEFRLIAVQVPGVDPAFPARLRQALAEAGLDAVLLPSFHNDYVLVREVELPSCLAAITRLLTG